MATADTPDQAELDLRHLVEGVASQLPRPQAKMVMFMFLYGGDQAAIARKAGLTEAEAQRLATLWKERSSAR